MCKFKGFPYFTLAICFLFVYTKYCNILRKWGETNMANIKSAKKRISVINVKTAANRRVKSHVKTVIRNFDKAVAAKDFETAKEKFVLAEKKLMQAAAKGTIHKNAASRKVSRLAKALKKAQAE